MEPVKLCLALGAAKAVEVPVASFVFQRELRNLCEQNTCGRYARNYTCPPFVGGVDALAAQVKTYTAAILWQNIYTLEDSFDFDGMMDAQARHNAMTLAFAHTVKTTQGWEDTLVLTAGGCFLCKQCAIQTSENCRHPGEALASLEAYGINVYQTCVSVGLPYNSGKDTVTFFSAAFFRN